MPELIPVLEKKKIESLVADLGRKISTGYQNKAFILIGILKRSFFVLADLMRHLTAQFKVAFIDDSSYGSGTSSSENDRNPSGIYHMKFLTGAH